MVEVVRERGHPQAGCRVGCLPVGPTYGICNPDGRKNAVRLGCRQYRVGAGAVADLELRVARTACNESGKARDQYGANTNIHGIVSGCSVAS
jgi:hypothetical protein